MGERYADPGARKSPAGAGPRLVVRQPFFAQSMIAFALTSFLRQRGDWAML